MEQRSIVVNIADFKLDVVENGRSILSMKVVVGKPYQRTPVFTAKMTYLVINPVVEHSGQHCAERDSGEDQKRSSLSCQRKY